MKYQSTQQAPIVSTDQCILCRLLEESYRAQHQVLRTRIVNAAQTLVYLLDRMSNKQQALEQIKIIVDALPR